MFWGRNTVAFASWMGLPTPDAVAFNCVGCSGRLGQGPGTWLQKLLSYAASREIDETMASYTGAVGSVFSRSMVRDTSSKRMDKTGLDQE